MKKQYVMEIFHKNGDQTEPIIRASAKELKEMFISVFPKNVRKVMCAVVGRRDPKTRVGYMLATIKPGARRWSSKDCWTEEAAERQIQKDGGKRV